MIMEQSLRTKLWMIFVEKKGIKREYNVARTPQQNGIAERWNRTLIEAARTMLADFKLPTTFWAEAVSTACYVHNGNYAKYATGEKITAVGLQLLEDFLLSRE
ncbi:ribonuclease H-like domain-containing protein [Tanacetum coccineum]